MGYRVARACMLNADTALSDRSRIVLGRMAWAVLDKPQGDKPAAEYWAGWHYLVLPWDDGTRTEAALKSIAQRAIRELVRKGYIKTTGLAHLGHRQRYVITLDY